MTYEEQLTIEVAQAFAGFPITDNQLLIMQVKDFVVGRLCDMGLDPDDYQIWAAVSKGTRRLELSVRPKVPAWLCTQTQGGQ